MCVCVCWGGGGYVGNLEGEGGGVPRQTPEAAPFLMPLFLLALFFLA